MRRAERGPRQRKFACGGGSWGKLERTPLNKLSAWMDVPKRYAGDAVGLVPRGDNGRQGHRCLQVFSGWG